MSKQPVTYKHVVMFETWVRKNGTIYRKWKLENEKRWRWQHTPYAELPYVTINLQETLNERGSGDNVPTHTLATKDRADVGGGE